MSTRTIGTTNITVTEIGFGGAPIGNLYTPMSDACAEETVCAALDAGIRYFDTAPFYGHGLSERRLGAALRDTPRDDYIISTKVGRLLEPQDPQTIDFGLFPNSLPFAPVFDYSYDGVMRSVEDSLQRLGQHRIDIALIHDLEIGTHKNQEETDRRFRELMDGGYKALDKLRAEGVVRAIGGGLNEWQACERLAKAADFDCFLLAGRYTLLEQEALNTFLPLCVAKNISIIIGGPYNTGILATGAVAGAYYNYALAPPEIIERVNRIETICLRHDTPLAAAALKFPSLHPAVASVIPGARTSAEIELNAKTFASVVPDDLWAELKHENVLREDAVTP